MNSPRLLASGLHFGEAPRWHDGELWFSDFFDYAVKTVDLAGQVRVRVSTTDRPSGLGWLPDGRLLIVSMTDRRLLRVDDHRAPFEGSGSWAAPPNLALSAARA